MRIHSLKVNGFKRVRNAEIYFGDATFLIGANNSGKSSILKAIDLLLSSKQQLSDQEYYSEKDPLTGETIVIDTEIVLEAEFRNLPSEAASWRGFKGRVFNYDIPSGSSETGLKIVYKKTYRLGDKAVIEIKSKKREIKSEFEPFKKPQDFIDAGVDAGLVNELFPDLTKNISAKDKIKLEALDMIWNIKEDDDWFPNPGGIPGNVLSKLPKFILIPAETGAHEINSKSGALTKTLNELFSDVRSASSNYEKAQEYLNKLADELDPADSTSEFGKMMDDLNRVLSSVFPESMLHAVADLSNPDKALVPSFEIEMSSNIRTSIEHQGTGMVRAAVFGLLRFRQKWLKERGGVGNSIIIGFEEPEIYLHPSAANQMRDTIYELSTEYSQIIATTHSPYMIDLSRKPRQVLNRFHFDNMESSVLPFNVSEEYLKLSSDDKSYVKMLLKIDDYIAKAFFTKKVVIVEGDTEDIVLREALKRLPAENRLKIRADFEVVKARGKAVIISLVKYLKALGVTLYVIHDRDGGCEKAASYNEHIQNAVGDANCVSQLHECMEDVLGYEPPSSEKPYRAYKESLEWGDSWDDVPLQLREVLSKVFDGYI